MFKTASRARNCLDAQVMSRQTNSLNFPLPHETKFSAKTLVQGEVIRKLHRVQAMGDTMQFSR